MSESLTRIPELHCKVRKIDIDFARHLTNVYLPPHNYADMEGCIRFVERVDSGVLVIQQWIDMERDVAYVRFAANCGLRGWVALPNVVDWYLGYVEQVQAQKPHDMRSYRIARALCRANEMDHPLKLYGGSRGGGFTDLSA